jgi:hypothetical protein
MQVGEGGEGGRGRKGVRVHAYGCGDVACLCTFLQ